MGGFSAYFYQDNYQEEKLKRMGLNERQIKAVMYIKENGKITNKDYRELTCLSDEGARIDLNILVELDIFKVIEMGRNAHYILR